MDSLVHEIVQDKPPFGDVLSHDSNVSCDVPYDVSCDDILPSKFKSLR